MMGKDLMDFIAIMSFVSVLVFAGWVLFYLAGCAEHPAIKGTKLIYPECDVIVVEEWSRNVVVEVSCPGEKPFWRRYISK